MEIERLTIKNGEIGFYGDIYNKCSNKNDPKIRKQIESGKQYCDIKGYKYHQYSHKELSGIYKKLSLFEDIMEKYLIETPEMLDVRLSENSNVNKMFATKIEDLKTKLAESEKEIERLKSKEKKIRLHTKRDWFERCCRLEDKSISLGLENIDLKQELKEKEKHIIGQNALLNKSKENNKQLKQQLAEKRKKVVQEIRERLTKYTLTNDDFLFDISYKAVDVEKVLEKIERGV